MNLSSIVYLFQTYCPEFFELSLANIITVLTPVSCDYVKSFSYDGMNARDVSLTCTYHLSNIVLDNVFHKSMGQGITYLCFCCFFTFCVFIVRLFVWLFIYFFHRLIRLFSLGWRRWNQFYHLLNVSCFHISGRGKILNYNGLRKKRLTSLRWDLKSETYQAIPD